MIIRQKLAGIHVSNFAVLPFGRIFDDSDELAIMPKQILAT